MKINTRLIFIGLALILFLSALSACGESGTDTTTPPEASPTVFGEPSLTAKPTQEPTPTPPVPPYDPLTDPKIYWGTELDKCSLGYMGGHIWNGWRLEELLLHAEGDQPIAFHIFATVFFSGPNDQYYPNIDIDRIVIPNELDRDGTLMNLVSEYSRTETPEARSDAYDQILTFLQSVFDEWTIRLDNEEARIRTELYLEIAKERGFDPDTATWEEKRSAESEVTRRIENDERYWFYRNEREEVESLRDLRRKFLLQFEDFYIEDMRQVMIERGFIPVYETLAENPVPGRIEGSFMGTFVGTATQIKEAVTLIKDYEAYIFALAVKP